MKNPLVDKLTVLLDFAISEGRQNWDGYYGRDNKMHLKTVKESAEYKEFLRVMVAITKARKSK